MEPIARRFWVVRWVSFVALLLLFFLMLNSAGFAVWQTAAARTEELRMAWVFPAYQRLSWSLALLGSAVLILINIRPQFPNVRRASTLLVSMAVLIVLLAPYIWRFFAVDGCLDSGGAWNYDLNICEH